MYRRITSRIYSLRIPLLPDEAKGWKPYPLFEGYTANLQSLSCHVSVLTKDHCPHPPHKHTHEEILLLLSGEVDLILPDARDVRQRLKSGEFVYYPTNFAHTIQTVSEDPANYLMLRWCADPTGIGSQISFGRFCAFSPGEPSGLEDAFRTHLVFEGPTAYLRKFHCHTSTLAPGAGYDPHSDAYDVAIIILEGEVETLGERLGPHSAIFYLAGEPHGMRNPGEATAKYIVFEFHGSATALFGVRAKEVLMRFARAIIPRCLRRELRRLIGHVE